MATFAFTNTKSGKIEYINSVSAHMALRQMTHTLRIRNSAKYAAEGKFIDKIEAVENEDGTWEMGGKRYSFRMVIKKSDVRSFGGSSVSNSEAATLRTSIGADAAAQMIRQMQG
jgi:hypothetical protein